MQGAFAQAGNLIVQIGQIQNRVALLVDGFALLIGHIVVFQQLFAGIKMVALHLALGALDAACDHRRFNRLAFRHIQPVHKALDQIARKNAHQRVF